MANRNVSGNDPKTLHIAMFPWLAYGHLIPFLRVSILLAEKGHRVSFISTPKNIRQLTSHVPPRLSHLINFYELPLPRVDGIPDSAESTSDITLRQGNYLKKAHDLLRPSLTEFLRNSDRIDWIIQDFLSHWMPEVASRLEINLAMFLVLNATSMAFFGPCSMMLRGTRASKLEDLTTTPSWMDYPTGVRFTLHESKTRLAAMDPDLPNLVRIWKAIQGSKLLIIRSCRDFEPDANRVLDRIYDIPTVPVGFLHPKALLNHVAGVKDCSGDEKWKKLKNWLDGKEEKSVMYVAFGTEVVLEPAMMLELATGIEKSGVHFVLALRDQNLIPAGYEDRVSGQGFVWSGLAPQVEVLSHPSVLGFLTHCGWSSVVEALGLGRALVLFSGASADMGLVASLMHERRVGLMVPRDEGDGSFSSDDVARTIRLVMVEEEGEEIRANAWAAREVFGSAEIQDRCFDELNRALMGAVGSNRYC